MRTNTHVLLEKVSSINPGDLPDGYWLRGHLAADVSVGHAIHMWRYQRAPIGAETEPAHQLGRYDSSAVTEVEDYLYSDPPFALLHTTNSVWKLTVLPPNPTLT